METVPAGMVASVLARTGKADRPACRWVCRLWQALLAQQQRGHAKDGCCRGYRFMRTLAAEGRLNVIQWARTNECPWDESVCLKAAESGHLDVIQWVMSHRGWWSARACTLAAKNRHVEVIRWAVANGHRWNRAECIEAATRCEHTDLAAHLLSLIE